jgi:hypothetical protein
MSSRERSDEAGLALLAVLLIMTLLMGLAAALTTSINMDTGLRGAYHRSTTGFYAAESGLNRGMGDYRNIFLQFNVPKLGTTPGDLGDFAPKTITVGTRTVDYQISDVTAYDGSGSPPSITIPPGQLFGGLNSQEYDYIANSTAQSNGDTEANVNAEFKVGNIPLFQFVAFYMKDLEIAPGADMTLNGRIHTNGDLYLSADGATLLISDNPPAITTVQVTSKSKIFRGRKRQNNCDSGGRVVVDMLQDKVAPSGALDPEGLNCSAPPSYPAVTGGGPTREVLASELATWKGSMVNHVESLAIPLPDISARGGGAYWSKADLRIVLDVSAGTTWSVGGKNLYPIEVQNSDGSVNNTLTNNLRAFMADTTWNANNSSMKGTRPIFYTDVPLTNGGLCDCSNQNPTCTGNTLASCYSPQFANNGRVYSSTTGMTTDSDYRRGGFYNWREGKWMYLLNVNVQDLLAWNLQQWALSDHGKALVNPYDTSDGGIVLFLSVEGPDSLAAGDPSVAGSGNNYGVRIFGSGTLPFPNMGADPTGLTIVTDQAVYVIGDYNTAAKQPAAILADSVNVLSNAWFATPTGANKNDAQSNQGLAARVGANTTIYTAFIGGVDDTIPGATSAGYNGGFENYPRFHEDWGGKTLTYRGSFVTLGNPLHVSGSWNTQSYSPPQRNWNYDTDFNSAANLPPMSPRFVYVQQVLFTEEFK